MSSQLDGIKLLITTDNASGEIESKVKIKNQLRESDE